MAELRLSAVATRSLGRFVLNFRLVMILVETIVLAVGEGAGPPGLAFVLAMVTVASLVPLFYWDRLTPVLERHPALFAVDALVTVVLLVASGTEGPLLAYAQGTALLAGLFYGWRGGAFFATGIAAGYLWAMVVREPVAGVALDATTLVHMPASFLMLAVGGGAVRSLLVRLQTTQGQLAVAREDAARNVERARLAREMHDTLGKTLHGIALQAQTLPDWNRRDRDRAGRIAHGVARSAELAAQQARDLIADLRADSVSGSAAAAVTKVAGEWAQVTGTDLKLDVHEVDGLVPEARYELISVLREALRNVERHADAAHATVRLSVHEGAALLEVLDEGRGLPGPVDCDTLAAEGHYGVIGMRERTERVGGSLEIGPRDDGRGCRVAAEFLQGTAAADLPLLAESST